MSNYCTPSDVKTALDITSDQYDAQLSRIVEAVSRWIDKRCECGNNGFCPGSDTRYFGPEHVEGRTLWLDMPLLEVTTLTNGDETIIDAADYRLWPLNNPVKRQIVLKSTVSWVFDTDGLISVEGTWGYSLSTPDPVNEAAILMSTWLHQRYMAGLSDASASPELGQLIYSKPVPDQALALLQPWINERFLV